MPKGTRKRARAEYGFSRFVKEGFHPEGEGRISGKATKMISDMMVHFIEMICDVVNDIHKHKGIRATSNTIKTAMKLAFTMSRKDGKMLDTIEEDIKSKIEAKEYGPQKAAKGAWGLKNNFANPSRIRRIMRKCGLVGLGPKPVSLVALILETEIVKLQENIKNAKTKLGSDISVTHEQRMTIKSIDVAAAIVFYKQDILMPCLTALYPNEYHKAKAMKSRISVDVERGTKKSTGKKSKSYDFCYF